jgi:hypothetical protein
MNPQIFRIIHSLLCFRSGSSERRNFGLVVLKELACDDVKITLHTVSKNAIIPLNKLMQMENLQC